MQALRGRIRSVRSDQPRRISRRCSVCTGICSSAEPTSQGRRHSHDPEDCPGHEDASRALCASLRPCSSCKLCFEAFNRTGPVASLRGFGPMRLDVAWAESFCDVHRQLARGGGYSRSGRNHGQRTNSCHGRSRVYRFSSRSSPDRTHRPSGRQSRQADLCGQSTFSGGYRRPRALQVRPRRHR